MTEFIILPTQLYPRPKSFWKQWKRVVVIEDPHYVNKKMHPLKLWMHRASMREYFDSINHSSKTYIEYDKAFDCKTDFAICHPTDESMVKKYKKGTMIDPPGFLLKINELEEMDTSGHDVFYRRIRVKFDIMMKNNKPIGDKWSYDAANRQRFPKDYIETNPLQRSFKSKYINAARSIMDLSSLPFNANNMMWPTNRRAALKDLKTFVMERLSQFGPYQDAIKDDVVVGYHSCISVPLNIGLIIPSDVIKESMKYKIPIESLEGFLRQVIGWREYIRMKYILYGPIDWLYLKKMDTPIDKSWYSATTGIETLDWSIHRVIEYAYAPHIERLMLLANYAVLLRLRYEDVRAWFLTMTADGYDWVMLNVSMGVNGLSPTNRFMKRAYLTNGTYLKKMGLKLSKKDDDQLRQLYDRFIRDNKALAKKDYMLAAAVKRLN